MSDGIDEWADEIHQGDAFDILADLPDASVHAVVTDPPYGLAFMGRDWDDFDPKEYQEWCEEWATKAKTILKPGGHLLAFSGNRTHHRLFSGVEDAGFEIRDTITYHFGSGFPKALDVSKAIDSAADREGDYGEPKSEAHAGWIERGRMRSEDGDENHDGWQRDWMNDEDQVEKNARQYIPATDAAEEWQGWKTALKPATEFVVLARNPLSEETVAENIQTHGTGALNIDGTRIDTNESWEGSEMPDADTGNALEGSVTGELNEQTSGSHEEGRYPSNVVFDTTEAERLDREVGETGEGTYTSETGSSNVYGDKVVDSDPGVNIGTGDSGGPSRYFYTSKASRAERTEDGKIDNAHPTVKPIDLMEWLVRLVTREGQIVLEPFAGSGTTCKAAKKLGRDFIGIEQQAQWADVARVRCGLTPMDPSHVRSDDAQQGIEAYADGGNDE